MGIVSVFIESITIEWKCIHIGSKFEHQQISRGQTNNVDHGDDFFILNGIKRDKNDQQQNSFVVSN